MQNSIIINNSSTNENNVQIHLPKKKLFISYNKESPKKIVNTNMPLAKKKFNYYGEKWKPYPTVMNYMINLEKE